MQYSCGYIANDKTSKKVFDALKSFMCDKIQMQPHEQNGRYDFIFILVPNDYEAIRTIFKKVKKLRENDFRTPVVFFVLNKHSRPDPFHPESVEKDEIKELMGRQKFGDVSQAIFYGELIFKEEIDNERVMSRRLLNVLDISTLERDVVLSKLLTIHEVIEDDSEQIIPKYKERFYNTFVDFYDNLTEMTEQNIFVTDFVKKSKGYLAPFLKEDTTDGELFQHTLSCVMTKDGGNLEKLLAWADMTYAGFNSSHDSTHKIDKELFCAPMPFPLQELIDAKKEIAKGLKQENTKRRIKLLLIDNKIDKIKTVNQKGPLLETLEKFKLQSIFEIEMLGAFVYKKADDTKPPQFYKREFNSGLVKEEEYDIEKLTDETEEIFDFKEFKKQLQIYLEEGVTKISKYTYLLKVYEKIKTSHFILLDFFLNEENTYLAFDFIRDMSEVKKKNGDYSTTWYFITSAVYDSVVKYSQSGLLAEYYESAVVNAGDDPTNKKRQIIFVYKLLIFIQSRLRSFDSYKNAIYNHMLNDDKGQGNGLCCVTSTNKNMKTAGCLENCKKDDCLEKMQTYIKRYLTEYDNIWSLFYDEKHEGDYKDIAVLLDDTIKKFLWLPEADWQMVQHQIDYINAKLKILGVNRKFSCKYINGEIEKRSEIY